MDNKKDKERYDARILFEASIPKPKKKVKVQLIQKDKDQEYFTRLDNL